MKKTFQLFRRNPNFYGVFHILISSFLSLLVMCFLFPELFLHHQYSFIRFIDQEIDSYGVFTIISNFFHGGIQLWDKYDQMPLAYFYLNGGMTSLSNLFTAGIYILVSPFLHAQAEAFHSLYSIVYFYAAILIRSAGFYLLLSRFTKKKSILLFSTVFGSTFMSPQSYLGLTSGNIYSFFPLMIHFILRLFETRRFKYLLLFILLMTICVANYPLMGLGYFYLGVHLVLFSTFIWFLAVQRSKIFHPAKWLKFRLTRRKCLQILATICLSTIIIFPFAYMLKENYRDYDFAHEQSRFANLNVFDVTNYFKRDTQIADPNDFFHKMFDYEYNQWYANWLFLGITAVFFIVSGIVLSRNSKKYIFVGTALLFWLINNSRDINSMYSWPALGHWVVALTNPFNFTLRSFHMTGALMLPFVLMPLFTMGLESVFDVYRKPQKSNKFRILLVPLVMLLIFISIYLQASTVIRKYYLTGLSLTTLFLLFITIGRRLKKLSIVALYIIILLIIIDGFAMHVYYRSWLGQISIIPQNLPLSKKSQFIDYQNPEILPFRQFYTVDPREWTGWQTRVDVYNVAGLFFHRTNLGVFFLPASIYFPKHISYSRFTWDTTLREYLAKDDRFIYQADLAVPQQEGLLKKLILENRDRTVIQVEGNPQINNIFLDKLPINLPYNSPSFDPEFLKIPLDLAKIKPQIKDSLAFYSIKLPKDFPSYLASDIFTSDSSLLKVKIGEKELSPDQGNLIHPFTFDAQNMQLGYLVIALPKNFSTANLTSDFSYPANIAGGITKLWKHEPDNLGFDYHAEKDGWLVFQYPYDRKWQIQVDGVKKELFKANYSFIGVPIQKGDHKILLQYWPDTGLRYAIALSLILLINCPVAIVLLEIRELNKCRESESN